MYEYRWSWPLTTQSHTFLMDTNRKLVIIKNREEQLISTSCKENCTRQPAYEVYEYSTSIWVICREGRARTKTRRGVLVDKSHRKHMKLEYTGFQDMDTQGSKSYTEPVHTRGFEVKKAKRIWAPCLKSSASHLARERERAELKRETSATLVLWRDLRSTIYEFKYMNAWSTLGSFVGLFNGRWLLQKIKPSLAFETSQTHTAKDNNIL